MFKQTLNSEISPLNSMPDLNEFQSSLGKVAYNEYGNSNAEKTIIMIHGLIESKEIWNETIILQIFHQV